METENNVHNYISDQHVIIAYKEGILIGTSDID